MTSTGNSLMSKMADDERTMLSRKLGEMSSRTKSLQNKMLDVNNRLRSSNEVIDKPDEAGDDNEENFSHVSLAHANLRDHTDWVLRKKRELSSLSLDGDVKGLRRQFEEHTGFRHQLNEKGSVIQNHLSNGQRLAGKFKEKVEFEACLRQLETEWSELLERSSEWNDDIVRMMDNVKGYEDCIKELNKL